MIIGYAGVGCGKSAAEKELEDERARDLKADKDKAAEEANKPPPVQKGSADPATGSAAPPDAAEPEPTTPAEIDHARNAAMIDHRDKDVLKYCELGKVLDAKPVNQQALLGCTLAACRIKDQDGARKYAKGIADKGLLGQAQKVCLTNSIGI